MLETCTCYFIDSCAIAICEGRVQFSMKLARGKVPFRQMQGFPFSFFGQRISPDIPFCLKYSAGKRQSFGGNLKRDIFVNEPAKVSSFLPQSSPFDFQSPLKLARKKSR